MSRDEVRQTSSTGGEKGSKGTALLNIPADFMLALAEHYGDGAIKYPSDEDGLPNFWKGYPMSLNIEALHRHWYAWLGGERDIPEDPDDPTSGNHHLLAVVWHCIDLWRKEMENPDEVSPWDDRPCTAVARRKYGLE